MVKQYEDIDVGLKLNSYTVNGLVPGHTYLFELCLRRESYIITISTTTLTTKGSEFQLALGIETDYVSLIAVGLVLTGLICICLGMSVVRLIHYKLYSKDGDSISQREMIASPSDHSSVTASVPNKTRPTTIVKEPPVCQSPSGIPTGDESRLVDHEVASPVDEVIRETIA